MTPAGEILRDEIVRGGPIPFSRFMEVALYHPEHGYYRKRDPFGRAGDFYTAEQLQPVFGLLVSRFFQSLWSAEGKPDGWTVVELGAGNREMEPFFARCGYAAVEVGDRLPEAFKGFVLANEFFDALPVESAVRRGSAFRLMRVGFADGRFYWLEAEEAEGALQSHLKTFARETPEGGRIEVCLEAPAWIGRVAASLRAGFLLVFDYGYEAREAIRFPEGTLMSYRRHQALEDVLRDPGEQDITAHVCFSALESAAHESGFEVVLRESMGRTLLRAVETDDFGGVFEAAGETERSRRRLQLKHLVFGMGESFRSLLLRRRT